MKVKLLKKVRKDFVFIYESDYYFSWAAYHKRNKLIVLRGINLSDAIRRVLQQMYGFKKGIKLFRLSKHNK